jgi:hypothetical protein
VTAEGAGALLVCRPYIPADATRVDWCCADGPNSEMGNPSIVESLEDRHHRGICLKLSTDLVVDEHPPRTRLDPGVS